jgi:hypothetical protein
MNWNHAAFSVDPRRFGRRSAYLVGEAPTAPAPSLSHDVRLFATTFAGGFLFVFLMVA